jgi:pantetheine-phosphate adenylyltransferase
MRRAIYPGTFDPITNGHIDILRKAAQIFDEVVVGVAEATGKKTVFTTDERVDIACHCVRDIPGVSVSRFDGLVVEFAEKLQCPTLIRGLRAVSDFEFELQLALMNKNLDDRINTIFLVPDIRFLYLSSSMVREVIALGGDLSDFVPEYAGEQLRRKLQKI